MTALDGRHHAVGLVLHWLKEMPAGAISRDLALHAPLFNLHMILGTVADTLDVYIYLVYVDFIAQELTWNLVYRIASLDPDTPPWQP